jgi:glycosyltransferase involved in cell wall biosynthesis
VTGKPKLMLLGGDGGRSGVPRYLGQLAAALADRAEITVVSQEDRGGYGFVREMGLQHRVVDGLASSLHPVRLIRATAALGRIIAEERPDVVWANARVTLAMARWCLMRGAAPGARLITTYHGIPFGPGHGLVLSAIQKLIERTSLYWGPDEWQVFLTEEDRAAMGPLAGGRHRVRVVSNGSDLGSFQPRQGGGAGPGIRLVMLTRDARQKNLDAAARLMAVLPDTVTLALYGIGTQSEELKQRFAAVLKPGGLVRIRFGGPIGDVRGVLAAADGLLVTSRYEGQSLAMLEAMEYGLPVFTTPVGGTAGLMQVHPMMALLALDSPADVKASADRLVGVARAWKHDSAAASTRIHQAWAGAYSISFFQDRVRALFDEVTVDRPGAD